MRMSELMVVGAELIVAVLSALIVIWVLYEYKRLKTYILHFSEIRRFKKLIKRTEEQLKVVSKTLELIRDGYLRHSLNITPIDRRIIMSILNNAVDEYRRDIRDLKRAIVKLFDGGEEK